MVYFMLFWMGSMYKSALLMMGLHKALCFGFTVFLLYMNALPEGVIYNITNCTYFKCV